MAELLGPVAPTPAETLGEDAEGGVLPQRITVAPAECLQLAPLSLRRGTREGLPARRQRLHLDGEDAVAIDQREAVELGPDPGPMRQITMAPGGGGLLDANVERVAEPAAAGIVGTCLLRPDRQRRVERGAHQ